MIKIEEYEVLTKEIEADGYEIDKLRELISKHRRKILQLKLRIKGNKEILNRKFENLDEQEFLTMGRRLGYIE